VVKPDPGDTIPGSSPVPWVSPEDALALTLNQQTAIGFFCGD